MIRPLVPAVLVLVLAAAAPAAAGVPVRTYAYISQVDVRTSGGADDTRDHCTFTVQVPRSVLEHAPEGARPDLLTGATTAHDHAVFGAQDEFDCAALEHTWQAVTLDPDRADRVSIVYPPAKPNWPQRIVLLALAVVVTSYVLQKLTGRSLSLLHYVLGFSRWRSKRRAARRDARIAAARAGRLARAQVVETKRDSSPRE